MRLVAGAIAVIVVAVLVACGSGGGARSAGPVPRVPAADRSARAGDGRTFELWFVGFDTASCCLVFSTSRTASQLGVAANAAVGAELIERLVEAVIAGPSPEEETFGLISSLAEKRNGVPQAPSHVRLNGVSLDGGIATIDLSRAFTAHDGPGLLALTQIVYTVTQFPEITGVRFAIDGRPIKVGAGPLDLAGQGTGPPLDRPVTRKDYEAAIGWVTITAPIVGAQVRSPLRVAGTAYAEGPVSVVLSDETGTILAHRTAAVSCGSRCRGTFDVELPFAVPGSRDGYVAISSRHEDCSTGHCALPEIPVRLTSPSIAFSSAPRVVDGRGPWPSNGVVALVDESLSGKHVLVRDLTPRSEASWSPDARRLVYLSDGDIEVIGADGAGRRRLTNGGLDLQPRWSPDGRWIAFVRTGNLRSRLFVMRPDGTRARPLTPSGVAAGGFAWSPDGHRIALDRENVDGNIDIWVTAVNGSFSRRLTSRPELDCCADWSPDGKHIVFTSTPRRGNRWIYELWSMNADGSRLRRLTHNAVDDGGPRWSPDGRRIVFARGRDQDAEIYVMNADGSRQRRLTWNSAEDWGPVWSPDGRRIAFVRRLPTAVAAVVMDADGTRERMLATSPKTYGGSVAWTPAAGVLPAQEYVTRASWICSTASRKLAATGGLSYAERPYRVAARLSEEVLAKLRGLGLPPEPDRARVIRWFSIANQLPDVLRRIAAAAAVGDRLSFHRLTEARVRLIHQKDGVGFVPLQCPLELPA